MQPNPLYQDIQLMARYTTGTLDSIPGDKIVKINEMPALAVDLSVSGAAGQQGSGSVTVGLQVGEGLNVTVPAVPAVGATGNIAQRNRPFVIRAHGEDIPGTRLLIGREEALTTEAIAGAFPANVITPGAPVPGDGETYWNSALAGLSNLIRNKRFHVFYDAVNKIVGLIKLQLHKYETAVIPTYDPALDQGNAGRHILFFFLPVTEGDVSARATESARETAGTGPSWVLVRPVQGYTSSLNYQDDITTKSWYQIGSLVDQKAAIDRIEKAMTTKGRNQEENGRSVMVNLMDLECQSSGNTAKLKLLMHGGTIRAQEDHYQHHRGNSQPEVEILVFSTNAAGFVSGYHIPRAQIDPNGNRNFGGTENPIPFLVHGMETPIELFDHDLMQIVPLAINCTVTV